MKLSPSDAALYAIIAIDLVLVGAILTPGQVGLNERGAVMVAIASSLFAIAWRMRNRNGGPPSD